MKHLHADRRLAWLVAVLGGLMTAVFLALSLQSDFRTVSLESGPIENTQLVLLPLAALAFAALAARTGDADRAVAAGTAILCSIFFLREVDFRPYGPDFWASFVHDRTFKVWSFSIVTIGLGIYLFLRRDLIPGVLRYSASRGAWPLVLGGGFLVAGLLFENIHNRGWHDPFLIFLEELAEAWGYLTFFLAASWFLRNSMQRG